MSRPCFNFVSRHIRIFLGLPKSYSRANSFEVFAPLRYNSSIFSFSSSVYTPCYIVMRSFIQSSLSLTYKKTLDFKFLMCRFIYLSLLTKLTRFENGLKVTADLTGCVKSL